MKPTSISNKAIIYFILALLIIGATTWYIMRPKPIANLESRTPKTGPIIAFGDSLIYGYGSTKGHDMVSDLSQDVNEPIINMGRNGDTTGAALARIDEVLKQKPKLVILLVGGNDFLRRVPIDETFSNLDSIIQKIQDTGSSVLVLGIRGGLLTDPFKNRFEAITKKYNTGYVPDVLDGLLGKKEYMFDTIHPNDTGYAKITKQIAPILQDILDQMK